MTKFLGMITVLVLMAAVMISCEEGTPKVNGKNVLTLDQYNKLMASMQSGVGVKGAGAQDAATSGMSQGVELFQSGQYNEALSVFQGIVTSEPENSRAWFLLGNSFEKLGQIQQAQDAYKTSYDLMVKKGYIPEVGGAM